MRWWWRLIRFGFRLLYNEFAWTYDFVSWVVSAGEWRAWQRTAISALKLPTSAHVLEAAHGTGNLYLDLTSAKYRVTGIDHSRAMGRIAARKLRRVGVEPDLIRASVMALPFASHTFDGLVCTFPSDFLIHPAALAEFRRVLKPHGRYAVVVHGVLLRGWWRPFLDLLFQITGQGGIRQDAVPGEDELRVRYLKLVAAFTGAGLTCDVIPMLTAKGYAVVLTGVPAPQ